MAAAMAMGEEEEKKESCGCCVSYYVGGAILGLALAVFLGNMMMWVIMPTFTYYLKWLPHILLHTHSTFFDIQGPIMLNFTFPILFIAVIGCFYIHLREGASNKPNISLLLRNDWIWWKAMRKPNIIRPLGIVTWTELFFAAMFVVLCVWYFAAYLHYHYTSISVYAAAKGVPVWQAKIDRLALVAGLTGNICLTFLFYPVTRRSSILPMLGLTSEGSIKYHIWLGHAAMTLFTAHGVLYILFWAVSHRLHEMLQWDPHYISNVAGEICLAMGLMMWVTTLTPVRRRMFELFFYTHYLYIAFMLFFALHTGFFYACIMLPGFYLFLVDRYLRFLQSRQNVRLLSARLLPCQTSFELNFAKTSGLKYNPTSIMFINVPTISKLQWHPFTITSNCNMEEDTISAIVKCEGSWTKKLFHLLSSPSPLDSLQVSVEGPYGPAQTHFLRHDVLVMISGGSGITPFISIIKEVITSSSQNQKTPKLVLIAIFKNSSHLSTLDLLLPLSTTTPTTIPNHLDIQIEAYITRETKPTTPEKPKPIRTVWLKPSASDTPIAPVLGPHGWLWLAAIISASFLIYLLLVGVLYQYYVYPMDHGTNMVFPYYTRALLNMLFMCFAIGVSASSAFLWNKKKMAMEANKKILETGDSSSLGSGQDDNHQELESFPAQSLHKMINTHYYTRPDLKRILMGIEGSSVGVLASGPKTLRHHVAAICSSGLLSNVTFESISFNW